MSKFSTSSWRGHTKEGSDSIMEVSDSFPAGGSVVKGFISVRQDHLPVELAPYYKSGWS